MRRPLVLGLAAVVLVAGAVGAFAWQQRGSSRADDPVRIGAGPDHESRLVAHVLAELLVHQGFPAEVSRFRSTADARQGLEIGAVDVVPAYTGSVWLEEYGLSNPPRDVDTSYERVSELDADEGLVWLPPTQVNATFAFVVKGPPGEWAHLERVFDLSVLNTESSEKLCVDQSFATRTDGLQSLVPRVIPLDRQVLTNQILEATPEQAVTAVVRGDCLAGLTSATDGAAWLSGLKVLRDERQGFPAFVLAPVVREGFAEERPEAVEALRRFDARVDTRWLARWNARTIQLDDPAAAAEAAAAELLPGEDDGDV